MLLEQPLLLVLRDEQRTAGRENRMLRKLLGHGFEERPAGTRQGADLRRTVAFHEHCGRSPGRVIARLSFTLQQNDTPMRRKPIRYGGSRDASTNDDEIRPIAHLS